MSDSGLPSADRQNGGKSRADEPTQDARRLFARPWLFMTSAPDRQFLPAEGPVEIAFAGRSNVGKSSLINAVCGQGGLARTSNTPGRTQALNFFIPEGEYSSDRLPPIALVDLPGYGFAKAPKAQVDKWTRSVFGYLKGRSTLKRVFVLIDSRHGMKPVDVNLLDMLDKAAVSYQIVLTKTDKLSAGKLSAAMAETGRQVAKRPAAHPEIVATSSEKKTGIETLRQEIYALAQS